MKIVTALITNTAMNNIDFEYSRFVRAVVDDGTDFNGPLIQRSEAEHLVYGMDEVNEGFATALDKEAIYRSFGLKVDLSPQGASPWTVLRVDGEIDDESAHDVYSVEAAPANVRLFDSRMSDFRRVPKVTPDDANVAKKSIDFPGKRVAATRLDAISLDRSANPAEVCFIDQLTVCQALSVMGADATGLIEWVAARWGVPFVSQLVRDVSLAPIGSVELYMATGGRPTPSIYVSPNYMAGFRVVQKPTFEPEKVFVSGVFHARFKVMAKFRLAMTTAIYGPKFVTRLSFYANPAQMSPYAVGKMGGSRWDPERLPTQTSYAGTIEGRESFLDFLRCRQATKQFAGSMALTAVKAAESVIYTSDATSFYSTVKMKKREGIMDAGVVGDMRSEPTYSTSAPARILSLLYTALHEEPTAETYKICDGACWTMGTLMSVRPASKDIFVNFSTIYNMPGMSGLLSLVNVEAAGKKIKEIGKLMISSEEGSKHALAYLISRALSLTSVSHSSISGAVKSWLRDGCAPTALAKSVEGALAAEGGKSSKPRRVATDAIRIARRKAVKVLDLSLDKYKVGEYWRTAKMYRDYAKIVTEQRPFFYLKRHQKAFSAHLKVPSVFDSSLSHIEASSRKFNAWLGVTTGRKAKVGVTTASAAHLRPVIARFRIQWSTYYELKARALTDLIKLIVLTDPGISLAASCKGTEDMKAEEWPTIWTWGLAVEIARYIGISMAYKFYQVWLAEYSPGTSLGGSMISYEKWLLARTADDARSLVRVDPKIGQLSKNSKLSKEMTMLLRRHMGILKHVDMDAEVFTKIATVAYAASEWAVSQSVKEIVRNDWYTAEAIQAVRASRHDEEIDWDVAPSSTDSSEDGRSGVDDRSAAASDGRGPPTHRAQESKADRLTRDAKSKAIIGTGPDEIRMSSLATLIISNSSRSFRKPSREPSELEQVLTSLSDFAQEASEDMEAVDPRYAATMRALREEIVVNWIPKSLNVSVFEARRLKNLIKSDVDSTCASTSAMNAANSLLDKVGRTRKSIMG